MRRQPRLENFSTAQIGDGAEVSPGKRPVILVPAALDERALQQARNRHQRRYMPPLPAIGPLQPLSASGSLSTVRPSGTRGTRERTQAGQAGLFSAP